MSEPETDLIPLRDTGPHAADPHLADPHSVERPVDDSDLEPAVSTDLVIASQLDHGAGVHRVFAGLDFRLPAGSLGVVHGTDGSGKSTLLLALIGRATGVQGSLQVAGHDALSGAKKLRAITTAARIGSVVDTEPKHSVLDAVRERAAIEGLRAGIARHTFGELADVLQLRVSDDQLVEELDSYQRTSLALALACLRPSTLLVLDDADHGLNIADQQRLFAAISQLMAYTDSTVVISTAERETIGDGAVPIILPAPGRVDRRRRDDAEPRTEPHSR